jgi:endonuclease YncB( thermonuclease family)
MTRARPWLILAVALIAGAASADTLSGRVVRVVDGDTLVLLLASQQQERIRLAGIDCPERGQAFGKQAKERLSDLAAGRSVTVDWHKRDRYGRVVGRVLDSGQDLNLALVRDGMCWWYRKYADEQSHRDQRLYREAEEAARAGRRGLWRDKNPVPPWEWRQR